jgi:hypothetical protein
MVNLKRHKSQIYNYSTEQTRGSKMSEKKKVDRNIAITLGIVCIILIAGMGGLTAFYTSIVSDRDNTVSSLESQIANLEDQVGNLRNIVDLKVMRVIADNQTITGDQNGEFYWHFDASCSGYVSVTIYDSTDNPTSVTVAYTNFGDEYLVQKGVSTNGTAAFPIMASMVKWCTVGVSIHFSIHYSSATVTVIYCY